MPVFISPDVFDRWLDPQKLEGDEIDATLSMLTAESERIAKRISTYEVDPGRDDSVGVALRAHGGAAVLVRLDAWRLESIWP